LASKDVGSWNGLAVLVPQQRAKLAKGAQDNEHAMFQTLKTSVIVLHFTS
jgi:hypothetical protein